MMFKELITTKDHSAFFIIILFILLIFLVYFSYIFFKIKVYQDLQKFLFHIKIVIYTLFIILCIISLITNIIELQIREGDESSSVIWVIIIVLLMGVYLSTTFGAIGVSQMWLKFLSIIFLGYLSFTGFGYLGFRIIFDFPEVVILVIGGLWKNNVFQSNTPLGLYFFWDNLPFFLVVYTLAFTLEGEKRAK